MVRFVLYLSQENETLNEFFSESEDSIAPLILKANPKLIQNNTFLQSESCCKSRGRELRL